MVWSFSCSILCSVDERVGSLFAFSHGVTQYSGDFWTLATLLERLARLTRTKESTVITIVMLDVDACTVPLPSQEYR